MLSFHHYILKFLNLCMHLFCCACMCILVEVPEESRVVRSLELMLMLGMKFVSSLRVVAHSLTCSAVCIAPVVVFDVGVSEMSSFT